MNGHAKVMGLLLNAGAAVGAADKVRSLPRAGRGVVEQFCPAEGLPFSVGRLCQLLQRDQKWDTPGPHACTLTALWGTGAGDAMRPSLAWCRLGTAVL
jgi:hypothetical protein